jgi:hypothetical protein
MWLATLRFIGSGVTLNGYIKGIDFKGISLISVSRVTAADAASLFNVHPATVSRLLRRGNVP